MEGLTLPAEPGTYALVCENTSPLRLQAGCLGSFTLDPGRYVYIGSAHGPGGLQARVARHLRRAKRLRWHIDYLAEAAPVIHVVAMPGRIRLECAWVGRLTALPGVSAPIPRFGSSDCRAGCPAHLLRLPDGLRLEYLDELLTQDS